MQLYTKHSLEIAVEVEVPILDSAFLFRQAFVLLNLSKIPELIYLF
jgi:hypothetical protein